MKNESFNHLIRLLCQSDINVLDEINSMSPAMRQQLLMQAQWHRVFMLLYLQCKTHLNALPTAFAQALNQRNQQLLRRGLLALGQLNIICQAFRNHGIDFMLFKGMAISALIYDSPIMRNPKDMDIFLRPDDIKHAHDILESLNYRLHTPDISPHDPAFIKYMQRQKDVVYLHHQHDVAIEIHWRLDINSRTLPINFDTWWQNRRQITIGDVSVYTFGLNDTLSHLAAHGCISMWGRLCWLLDWRQLRQQVTPEQWRDFIHIANQRELTHMVNIAESLSEHLCPVTKDHKSVDLKPGEKYAFNLAAEHLPLMHYPKGYQRYLARLMLKPGVTYKFNYIFSALRMLFAKERNIKQD